MKIAVYSIARNEVHEVAGWEQATREADYRLLLDTGSTDGTDAEMEKFPDVVVHRASIRPWRFDDARNAALALVPPDIDICISLDMDERLRGRDRPVGEGWREAILSTWHEGVRMLRCPIDSGGLVYYSYRIHSREGWRWKSPVHEILHWRGEGPCTEQLTESLIIDHFPVVEKPRPAPRRLLEEAVRESPQDARMALQYGWQLLVDGDRADGFRELYRYLDLSVKTGVEAAFIHRLIAQYDEADTFLDHMNRAEEAHPAVSNSILLADHYYRKEMWQACYTACQAGIARQRMRPEAVGHWGDDARRTTSWLHDTASSAAWMVWDFEACLGHAVEAYRRNPDESRRQNVLRIQEHIANGATLENMPKRTVPKPEAEPAFAIEIRRASRQKDLEPASEEVSGDDRDKVVSLAASAAQ